MSALAGLGALANGLAGGINAKKDREEAAKQRELQDRMLKTYETMAASGGSMGAVGGPMSGELNGSQGSGLGAVAPGQTSGNGDLFSLIDKHEGGGRYDTLFGHSQNGGQFNGVDVSKMTIGELGAFASPSGEYGQWVKGKVGRVATPMGRHQIVGTTLRAAASEMGLSPETVFSPQTQDSMAAHLARKRLSGAKDPGMKRSALRAEWEGFKNVSDADLDAAIAQFEADGGMIGQRPLGAYGSGPQ